jgi:hypothetical protein
VSKAKRLREERAAATEEQALAEAELPQFASESFSRKLDRAKTHIDALEDSIKGWLQTDAYTIAEEREAETGDYVFRAKITQPLDEDWSLLIGDAVHNLRSALDHIAYRLAHDGYEAQNPGGTIPIGHQRRIMFPVVAFSNDERLSVEDFYTKVIVGQLRYVPSAAAACIEALQPYKRSAADPGADPLWVVNDLDVIDKHRKLHTTAIAHPLRGIQATVGDRVKGIWINPWPVEHDAVVMRWNVESASGKTVKPQARLAREIALKEGPPTATKTDVIGLLRTCHRDITDNVVPALAQFLG